MPIYTFDWHTTRDPLSGYVIVRADASHRALLRARREVRAQRLEPRYDLAAIQLELRLVEPDPEHSLEPDGLEPDFDG